MKYLSAVDVHTHLRGEEYPDHAFAQMALDDARAVGLCGIIEMPNCKPFLTQSRSVLVREAKMRSLRNGRLYIRSHPCLVTDQDRKTLFQELQPQSIKIFFAHSSGNLGVIDPAEQKALWGSIKNCCYDGVVIGHFEDENVYGSPFDPKKPWTHSIHQHERAELSSVIKQILNAFDSKFRGTFYCAHASNPETIDYLNYERQNVPFKIAIEVTWHHMFMNWTDYEHHGNRVKMNPPLRQSNLQSAILQRVVSGHIDVIATDHAPHPIERKDDPEKPASGITGIPFWPKGIQKLRELGMHEGLIENVTFYNPNRIFQLDLEPRQVEVEYDRSLWDKYGYNPFSRVDK